MKVISFSIWGHDGCFQQGALENVHLAAQYYPDWKCMFYLGHEVPQSLGLRLMDAGAIVQWKTESLGAWEGLFWRFEPIYDPSVTHTLSRDCDSRLNPREAAAVNDWLRSGRFFHSMRDHYEHNLPIMGGMFGCLNWPRFEHLLKGWTQFGVKGCDQDFLNQKVWPEVQAVTLAHDRYADGLQMPNRDGKGIYEYKPLEQLGRHDLRRFPDHPPLDPKIHGEHVGARVGLPA
jgi:protein O-GlcNAc transferase